MIFFFIYARSCLNSGINYHEGHSLVLRGMEISPGLSIQEISKKHAHLYKPQYMCGWALELLRNVPICIGLDFRRFFFRYSIAFGDRPGRCSRGHRASCKGDEPGKCQRFRGMPIEN